MFKNRLNGDQMIWVGNNLGLVIKVLVLVALVISSFFIPHAVLAEPSMGGSVGSLINGLKGI